MAKALEKLFDVFGEDDSDQIFADLMLLQTLVWLRDFLILRRSCKDSRYSPQGCFLKGKMLQLRKVASRLIFMGELSIYLLFCSGNV